MAKDLLIGTGFVGQILLEQRSFDEVYSMRSPHKLKGSYRRVYCAAMPGQKWKVNANVAGDCIHLDQLMDLLKTVRAEEFVLISTVDVFGRRFFRDPVKGDERSPPNPTTPYGINRFSLEQFVKEMFPAHLIVRLPNIIHQTAQKGPLYDLKYRHRLQHLDPNSIYQFYPAERLDTDIDMHLRVPGILHLVGPPTSIQKICQDNGILGWEVGMAPKIHYDIRTAYLGPYWCQTDDAIQKYFSSAI